MVRMLKPRKLDSHLTDSRPNEEDAHYYKWLEEEEILISWILDSMKPEVSDRFIDYASVKDIWDTVIRFYSKLEDESRMAELNRRVMELLQEPRSVLEYSNELAAIWNEVDFYRPLPTDQTGREYILKGITYCFLTELRSEFETIRGLLLNRERPLSFDESVIPVVKEESRLLSTQTSLPHETQVLLTKNAIATPLTNISTAPIHGQSSNAGSLQMSPAKQSYNQTHATKKGSQKKKVDTKDNLWCDFCKKYRHTRETC